jgi:hypothetical protein
MDKIDWYRFRTDLIPFTTLDTVAYIDIDVLVCVCVCVILQSGGVGERTQNSSMKDLQGEYRH